MSLEKITSPIVLKNQNALLQAIHQMQNNFFKDGINYGWCEETLRNLLLLTNSKFGFICELLHKEDGTPFLKSHVITDVAWSDETRKFYEENKEKGLEFFNFKSIWGQVFKTGKAYISDDPDNDKNKGGYPKKNGHPHLKSFLGLPIKGNSDEIIGIMAVANNPDGYENDDAKFLEPFVTTYGLLIEQEKLKNADNALKQELIEAKQRAEENEEKFSTIFKMSQSLICVAGISDARFKFVNPTFKTVLGYDENELLSKSFLEFVHPDDRKPTINIIEENLKKGIPQTYFVNRYKSKGGPYRYLAWNSFPVKEKDITYAIAHDITEQKEYEIKLKEQQEEYAALNEEYKAQNDSLLISKNNAEENENKWRTLVQIIPDWIAIIDKDNKFTFMNRYAEGFDETNVIGFSVLDFILDSSKEIFHKVINEVRKSWSIKTFEHFAYGNNKEESYYHNYMVPLDRNVGTILIISRDITDRKKSEKDLIDAKERAENANRLKTEFLNNMSHEIRTPMNGIIGFSDLLNKPNIPDEKRKYFSKIIKNSSTQLMRIIDDILEISILETKQNTVNKSAFSLNNFLMELFSVFNLQSKERNIPIYIIKALKDHNSNIITDRTKLGKILNNLIENALKYTAEGFIEIGYSIDNETLTIYVKDTGIGISPKNHDLIFERFAQEDKEISKKTGGLGLGLSISKENAQLLGGDISLESNKGKGSTFFINIPYEPATNKNGASSDSDTRTSPSDSLHTILIAEDEEVNYLYIETLFEDEFEGNYKLIHAKNGKEAVDLCSSHNDIDLVLMDIKMPIMNGHEATKKIKSKFPEIPIIAQTAYSTESDKAVAIEAGCNDFISKPLNTENLFGMIKNYLNVE